MWKLVRAGTVVGGLLLFALGALLTASYIRLRRRRGRSGDAVMPGVPWKVSEGETFASACCILLIC